MLLGQVIRDLADETKATEALIGLGDLALLARVETTGSAHGESRGAYAAGAVARFADQADDEAWLGLMNKIERTDDPASACLRTMIEWSLQQDAPQADHACTCGHGH